MLYQYAFLLGREWKLSLAEIGHVFGFEKIQYFAPEIAIIALDYALEANSLGRLGGTTRILEITGETTPERFATDVIHLIESRKIAKISFALGVVGGDFSVFDTGLRIKKTLTEKHIHSRLLNRENTNIHAAVFKRERLRSSQSEFFIIFQKNNEKCLIATTLACQDIDAYSRRDLSKNRDMIVGMMPPKLVQMMINIGTKKEYKNTLIYDPFCGLGTTLIEAANLGFEHLAGSDISTTMVTSTEASLADFLEEEQIWQDRIRRAGGTPEKDARLTESIIWQMDATRIGDLVHSLPEIFVKNQRIIIVSEGYLGAIMSRHDITRDRIDTERAKLTALYQDFFAGIGEIAPHLHEQKISLVMSFPFWNLDGKYIYLDEIYGIFAKNNIQCLALLPDSYHLTTLRGSLLYRRESQSVGREIVHLSFA